MASLSRKYIIAEQSGNELGFNQEALPNSEDIAIVTDTTNTMVGSDLQDVLTKLNRPSVSQLPTYSSGDVTAITFYKNSTQITANRIAAVSITYTSGEPTSETWTLYSDIDGTTVLKTYTITHTWSSGNLTNTTTATT